MKLLELLSQRERLKSLPLLVLAAALTVSVSLLFLNSMLQSRDGRSTVLSREGQNETQSALRTDQELRLQNMLECIQGVGAVEVMICSDGRQEEKPASLFSSSRQTGAAAANGVIVAAEGGDNPVVRSRIVDAVSTVCQSTPSDVAVFALNRHDEK